MDYYQSQVKMILKLIPDNAADLGLICRHSEHPEML